MYKLVIYNENEKDSETLEINHFPGCMEMKELAPGSLEAYLVEEDHNGETFAMYMTYRYRKSECFRGWRPYYMKRG